MDELRKEFERLHPVHEFLAWSDEHNCYVRNHPYCDAPYREYNAKWQGFQSGYAAGLDRSAQICDQYTHADWAAKAIRAAKEQK